MALDGIREIKDKKKAERQMRKEVKQDMVEFILNE